MTTRASVETYLDCALAFAQQRAKHGRIVDTAALAADQAFRSAIDRANQRAAPSPVATQLDGQVQALYAEIRTMRNLLARQNRNRQLGDWLAEHGHILACDGEGQWPATAVVPDDQEDR